MVVSDPPWPVLSAWSRSAASPPLTSPTTMWSGPVAQRVPHQVADRYGGLGADSSGLEAEAVGAVDPEFERVLDGDDPLVFGQQLDQRVEERRLARARASGDQDVPAGQEGRPGGPEDRLRQRAHAHQVLSRERAAPEPAYGDGDLGTRGRRADGDPRPVLEDGHRGWVWRRDRGRAAGRCGWPPGRARRRGERWCFDGLELAAAFDPDVAGAVDHQLGDLRIFEHGLEAGQERLQVSYPARALHRRPSSRSRQ